MVPLKFAVQLLFCGCVFAQGSQYLAELERRRTDSEIELKKASGHVVHVEFEEGKTVKSGNRLSPSEVMKQPIRVEYETVPDTLYTFVIIGPHVGTFLHWLIVNIPGQDLNSGYTVAEYIPLISFNSRRPFIFLVYKQNERINPDPVKISKSCNERLEFDIVEFKRNHNITDPVAGNFMYMRIPVRGEDPFRAVEVYCNLDDDDDE